MSASGPVGVGVIGAGTISAQYLKNLTSFPDVEVRFVADIETDRAAERATEFGVGASGTVEHLLADDGVEVVVNLTIPAAHAEVGLAAVRAGKHLWNEKPITLDHDSAAGLLAEADKAGVHVGVAPDTVLGPGLQTAFRAIADGAIGQPLSAIAMMLSPGPESWHPSPEFLFAQGAGPLYDIGPYYLTTLISVLGSVERVAAASSRSRDERVIGSGPKAGRTFPVEVPTLTSVLMSCEGGASAQSTFSFQSALSRAGFVEVSGTEGVIVLPDPNGFGGTSTLWRLGADEPETIEPVGPVTSRGLGVLELARAVRAGQAPRANGQLAMHVLDVMAAASEATGARSVEVASRVERPEPLPADFDPFAATVTA